MKSTRLALSLSLLVAALAALAASGCSKSLKSALVPNQPPTVRLSSAPYDTTNRYFYSYRINWVGYDPDGRVDHYIYWADDGKKIPRTLTTKNEQIIQFAAARPDTTGGTSEDRSSDFHTFYIVAVDDQGDTCEAVTRSFYSYTVAPTVLILSPRPTHLSVAYVTPAVRINWTGTDPDGQSSTKPKKYKFKLFAPGGAYPISEAIRDPNAFRIFFAPNFVGWDSSSTDTTTVQYTNLSPNTDYLFAVVAFDEAGAYSPIFSLDTNMLRLRTTFAGSNGPVITMFNEFFFYRYPSGGYCNDPRCEVALEIPANQPVTFNWFADPAREGADIESYRWKLGGDVGDETPRTNEQTDVSHWSAPSLGTTSATVGPFARDTLLRFYIEATDNNGLKSLGAIRFTVVKPTFAKPVLFVNDTRLTVDQTLTPPYPPGFGPGDYKAPTGPWPSRAELDTFLFAVGGVPWQKYPTGTISPPGLFSGYAYDTATTETGKIDQTFPLSIMGQYRTVVWFVDQAGATIVFGAGKKYTSLRYMAFPNHVNTIATYSKSGGRLWLMGGGIALASLKDWTNRSNQTSIWNGNRNELIPGRMMYDLVHWRTEVANTSATITPTAVSKYSRIGVPWTGHGPNRDIPGPPNYGLLPQYIRPKNPSLDPFPPNRTGQGPAAFYQVDKEIEYITATAPNFIIEDFDPSILGVNEQSALDTLYSVSTSNFFLGPVMTYYHGQANGPLVFSGFPVWFFTRSDAEAVSRFVLTDVFGIPRTGPMPRTNLVPASAWKGGVTPVLRSAPRGSSRAVDRVLRDQRATPLPTGPVRKPLE